MKLKKQYQDIQQFLSRWLSHFNDNVLSNLVVQGCNLLMIGCGQQEPIHLTLQRIINFNVNVIAGCLLLVIWIHTVKITIQKDIKGTVHLKIKKSVIIYSPSCHYQVFFFTVKHNTWCFLGCYAMNLWINPFKKCVQYQKSQITRYRFGTIWQWVNKFYLWVNYPFKF